MKNYLLDTNIIVSLVRNERFEVAFKAKYPYSQNRITLSVVVVGELDSLVIQWGWGEKKIQRLQAILEYFVILPIKVDAIIHAYAHIDAFSQGKLPEKPLPVGTSARNMGKNDLWIAATAHATQATLLTTDADFGHLHSAFLDLDRIDVLPYL